MRTTSSIAAPSLPTPFSGGGLPVWPSIDLAAHHGSARLFHASCLDEMGLGDRLSQWTEWLDRVLARRFATSVVVVGSLAGLIALAA
jgi:hypothetical protein